MSKWTEREAIAYLKNVGFKDSASAPFYPFYEDDSWYKKALDTLIEAVQELQHYKALEEQGLLLKLPCKVGDTIYHIMDDWRGKPTIRKTEFSYFWLDYEIFLTKEEAERKLAELKGE